MKNVAKTLAITVVSLVCNTVLDASVVMETVPVGNPGNLGEWSGESYGGFGTDRICGAVDYTYNIGKYEVTAGQYTDFLNAVAVTDTYELYRDDMWTTLSGCRIERIGLPGKYSYRVAAEWANRPVNYISWGDAARFCNWMHNGQPTGLQGPTTTEDGSYLLDGVTSTTDLMKVERKLVATWVIPSEDEWYKAAYHKNNGQTGDYFDYPTSNDEEPSQYLTGDGNNATFYDYDTGSHTIGSPYFRTESGEHSNSISPYGTFDQGGNAWEYNETLRNELTRGMRGGSFASTSDRLSSAYRDGGCDPSYETPDNGFRLAYIPEPTSLTLLGLGGLAMLRRR